MIPTSSFISCAIIIVVGIALPLGATIWWVKTRKEKVTTVLLGAATWFVFAVLLEALPKMILFTPMFGIGQHVMGNVVLFTVLGALLAGVFEETGRFVVFKTLLRKRTNNETSISHGIGHGGFEAMYMMVVTGVQYIVFANMINDGSFGEMINTLSATGIDTSSYEAVPATIAAFSIGASLLWCVERVFAMLIHVALSIMVFYSVRDKKTAYYPLAIVLHALLDVPAALYQFGIIRDLWIVEILLAIYSTVFFVVVYKRIYQMKMQNR